MKCRECGNDILQSAQFCGSCGASVNFDLNEVNITHKTHVGFTTAIGLGFNRVFDFRGRSSRAEYWWWILFSVLGDVILSIVDGAMGTYNAQSGSGLISTIFGFFILIPSIALGVRRLHDINKSGWWSLMWLVFWLIVPLIVLLWWATKPSYQGTNKYGPDPTQAGDQNDAF